MGRPNVKGRAADQSTTKTFRLPNELLEWFVEGGWVLRKPVSDMAIEALEDYLIKHKVPKPRS